MRNYLLKTVCAALICITLILTFPITASSYDSYTYPDFSHCSELRLLQNENQVFLIGSSANKVYIEAVYPNSYNIELPLENNAYSYDLFNSTLVIICPVKVSKQTQIVLYDIDTDNLTSFLITGVDNYDFSKISYSEDCVYLSCSDGTIRKYSKYGKLVCTYEPDGHSFYLAYDLSSDIYACSNNSIHKINGSKITQFSFDNIFAPIKFVADNVCINKLGYYYKINPNGISKLSNYKSTVSFPSGGKINQHLIVAEDNTLFAIDSTDDSKDMYQTLQNPVSEICVMDFNIFTLSYQNGVPVISVVPYSSFIKCKQNNSDEDTDKIDNNSSIDSSVYKIDHKRLVITNIPYSTTIAQFKKNINCKGFNLKFTRYDGKEITSGNIGTATIVTFYKDNYSIKYEISVVGDLTGEGNVNTRDESVMFSYLLDEVSFTGIFNDSADIDKSNTINTTDLVLLLRLIDEQK